ncbi:histidine kinase dimerization/phosphoacceptor domain -containing protein [Halarcobacter sp.]|uniref:sensor histidine kinase n=1 Tax=Halarcobacter sp. TaxID=2321133 RepID=UPI0029F54208|nr:histidine kinase dimerization/phosphoacceptor domain -containing protein [Halarcobacter sp.]
MKKKQKIEKKNQIENMITLTNEQLKLATKLIIHSRQAKIKEVESKLNSLLEKNILKFKSKEQLLTNLNKKEGCDFFFLEDKKENLLEEQKQLLKIDKLTLYSGNKTHMCPKMTQDFFYTKIVNNNTLVTRCAANIFVDKHNDLEIQIKDDLQKSFNLTHGEHKGKINLIWINTKHKNYDSKPLYDINDETYNMKYCLSRMSSVRIPQTGKLTGKQIVEASNKEPIYHLLNTKENPNTYDKAAFTWVKDLDTKGDVKLYFLTTMYEEDFNRNFISPLLNIVPAAIFSLVIAIILGFFLFKRLFKSINILTTTAKEVNKGNINIRNNLQGNDDIALLGKAFDNMLDSIKENIENLDRNVEEKTKQLSDSLEEKETLLKEIHHRVKNNLAMTINLIKLQSRKIEDKKTKQILIDIEERIYTMELLHRKLYESKDLNSINFRKYIKELCNDLEKTYSNSKQISIEYDFDEINMNIEYALPCGIIITECVTNIYKYAFLSNQGNIKIGFKKERNSCFLTIEDNGIGLPNSVDFNKPKTLGLKLITSIVKGQLLGNINYKYEDGAKFSIDFSIN